jgi:D-alanine-D-alanine ligase
MAGIKYTGSNFKASCISKDKYISKLIAIAEGIPVPRYILLREDLLVDYQDPEDYSGFSNQLGLPIIVKPNDAGSSVGISRVEYLEDLKSAVQNAFKYSPIVFLDEYIPGRELTVTIIDGEAYPVVEIKPLEGCMITPINTHQGKPITKHLPKLMIQLLSFYNFTQSGYGRLLG